MLKFLGRYTIRILSALGAVFALAALVIGLRTGAKRSDCEALAGGAVITTLIAVLPNKNLSLRKRSSTPYVSPYVVKFDDQKITLTLRNKRHESVQWSDLVMVGIAIKDCFLPVPFWFLAGSPPGKGGCVYPNDAVGAKELLSELQTRLPDFDNVAVIRAMGMIAGSVIVWERPDWKAGYRPEQKNASPLKLAGEQFGFRSSQRLAHVQRNAS